MDKIIPIKNKIDSMKKEMNNLIKNVKYLFIYLVKY